MPFFAKLYMTENVKLIIVKSWDVSLLNPLMQTVHNETGSINGHQYKTSNSPSLTCSHQETSSHIHRRQFIKAKLTKLHTQTRHSRS